VSWLFMGVLEYTQAFCFSIFKDTLHFEIFAIKYEDRDTQFLSGYSFFLLLLLTQVSIQR